VAQRKSPETAEISAAAAAQKEQDSAQAGASQEGWQQAERGLLLERAPLEEWGVAL
jgi:hypothetical protein